MRPDLQHRDREGEWGTRFPHRGIGRRAAVFAAFTVGAAGGFLLAAAFLAWVLA